MDMTPIKTLANVTSLFENTAREFLTKGYYYIDAAHDYQSGGFDRDPIIPPMTLSKFVRRIAKEHKRPMISVWTNYITKATGRDANNNDVLYSTHPCGISIEIPKRKFTAPLIHCLTQGGFHCANKPTLWIFRIDNDEFAEQYLSFFETRPEFREACRLPPLTP